MKILEVNNLSLSFIQDKCTIDILKNISFSLNHSQTLGIVGESGSGKSLTALSIIRLIPQNASLHDGKVLFSENDGLTDLLILPEKEMLNFRGKNISMIFQEPMTSLNPSMKCGNQVAEVIIKHLKVNKNNAKLKVQELFDEVKLPDPVRIFNSYPHQLSGGQRQRVMIAMAIALKPSILIADEPTTALDVTVQKSIIELLKQIQQKYKMSIIFISHDLGIISQIADHILVMRNGEVIEYGAASEILNNPKQDYTKGLLKCRPTLQLKPYRLPTLSNFNNNVAVNPEISKKDDRQVVLSVTNLSKKYILKKNFLGNTRQEFFAINNISFNVYEGETLGLVGESGSGKTTLGRMICQLILNDRGNIYFKGKSLNELNKKQLREFHGKVQIIFQDPYSSLNPKITIGEAIMEPMKVHRLYSSEIERKEKTFDLLDKVRLSKDSFYKYPHEFSGGQRQRIVIARAVALQPEFIICDESVSALDVSVQAEILNLLNDLKDEYGLTYIFISHDLSVVKYMSDRVMVLKDGKLVEINDADTLYKSPASEYTKKLIDSIPDISK
ncbi:MAG: ABC transporter ATP-binding protein [Bacteroidetes bacterium GWC2_33_15]|nr:MAG: ABC transporter ATP-binding protein [Bacteroidetes bacterium GWA2_33_15]OFX51959.1 MAG: ABC transporter ATP-binding protein [Bacteroidetes bacterium GWC2_33_15]OFX63789.1 MAG: ABC transporter ATP-binding protein [Bacteroidetes bacterium GWB2_32_14]OFX67362.1 MAG: ABC transporter ATP-binding protein [Bacteroidetes bacterium GWD2_33_33]